MKSKRVDRALNLLPESFELQTTRITFYIRQDSKSRFEMSKCSSWVHFKTWYLNRRHISDGDGVVCSCFQRFISHPIYTSFCYNPLPNNPKHQVDMKKGFAQIWQLKRMRALILKAGCGESYSASFTLLYML